MRRRIVALLACLLLLSPISVSLAADSTGATMRLEKTEGTVSVEGKTGKAVSVIDGMRLYSGYTVGTQTKSYAHISLDKTKAVKLDASSEVEVRKSGSKLELHLISGELLCDVSQPLGKDESLSVRTSTMVTGIRGTTVFFRQLDSGTTEIFVLHGTVTVTAADPVTGESRQITVTTGQMAATSVPAGGGNAQIEVDTFTEKDIPGYVATELAENKELQSRLDKQDTGLDLSEVIQNADEKLQSDQQEAEGDQHNDTSSTGGSISSDNTAPSFITGYPKSSNVGSNSFDLRVLTDEDAKVYCVAYARDDSRKDPTAYNVVNGTDGNGSHSNAWWCNYDVVAGADKASTLKGLVGSKTYDIFFVAADRSGNKSGVYKISVTTEVDTTNPSFAETYPKSTNITPNSFDLVVKANEVANFYFVAYIQDASRNAPNADDVLAKRDGNGLTTKLWSGGYGMYPSEQEATIPIADLIGGKTYDVFVVAVDAAGHKSEVSTITITTEPDTIPPTFINGYPNVEATASTRASIRFKMSELGNFFYVAFPTSENRPQPNAQQIINLTDGNNVGANIKGIAGQYNINEAYTICIDGLTASTTYDVYAVAQDRSDNTSAVVKLTITTATSGTYFAAPTWSLNNGKVFMNFNMNTLDSNKLLFGQYVLVCSYYSLSSGNETQFGYSTYDAYYYNASIPAYCFTVRPEILDKPNPIYTRIALYERNNNTETNISNMSQITSITNPLIMNFTSSTLASNITYQAAINPGSTIASQKYPTFAVPGSITFSSSNAYFMHYTLSSGTKLCPQYNLDTTHNLITFYNTSGFEPVKPYVFYEVSGAAVNSNNIIEMNITYQKFVD